MRNLVRLFTFLGVILCKFIANKTTMSTEEEESCDVMGPHLDRGHWAEMLRLKCLKPCMSYKGQSEATVRQAPIDSNSSSTHRPRLFRVKGPESTVSWWLQLSLSFLPDTSQTPSRGRVTQRMRSREETYWGQLKCPILSPKQTLKSRRMVSLSLWQNSVPSC